MIRPFRISLGGCAYGGRNVREGWGGCRGRCRDGKCRGVQEGYSDTVADGEEK